MWSAATLGALGKPRNSSISLVISRVFDHGVAASCKWHVPCSCNPSDTGTSKQSGSRGSAARGGSPRGKEIQTRATDGQTKAPPSAHRVARVAPGSRFRNRFFQVTWSPGGSYPVPSCVGSRERGESNSSQPKLSSEVAQYQFTVRHKKPNTPGQRSRESSGVHPGHSLFSREEAARGCGAIHPVWLPFRFRSRFSRPILTLASEPP